MDYAYGKSHLFLQTSTAIIFQSFALFKANSQFFKLLIFTENNLKEVLSDRIRQTGSGGVRCAQYSHEDWRIDDGITGNNWNVKLRRQERWIIQRLNGTAAAGSYHFCINHCCSRLTELFRSLFLWLISLQRCLNVGGTEFKRLNKSNTTVISCNDWESTNPIELFHWQKVQAFVLLFESHVRSKELQLPFILIHPTWWLLMSHG